MDTPRFAFTGKHAGSPHSKDDLLLIDLGAHSIRVGFLTEDEPRCVMRTAVSKSKNKNACFRMGNEITEVDFVKRAYRTPFIYGGKEQGLWQGSLLLHFELVHTLLEYMFSFALSNPGGSGRSNHGKAARRKLGLGVFMIVPYCTPRLGLIILADILINYFGATSVSFLPSELSFSTQIPFQIVLHLGYSCTTAYPLFYSTERQEFSIPGAHLVKVLPLGMQMVHVWLLKFLTIHYSLFTHMLTETFVEYLLANVCVATSADVYQTFCARMCKLFSKCRPHKECLNYQETRYSDLVSSMDVYNCYLQAMETLAAEFPNEFAHPKGHSNMIHTGILLIELFEGARQNEALQTRQGFIAKARRTTLGKLLNGIRDRDIARLFYEQVAALNALHDTCSYTGMIPEDQQQRSTTILAINGRISRNNARNSSLTRQSAQRYKNLEAPLESEATESERGQGIHRTRKQQQLKRKKRDNGSRAFRLERNESDQSEESFLLEDEVTPSDDDIEESATTDTTESTETVTSTGPTALSLTNDSKSGLVEPGIKKETSANVIKNISDTSKDTYINVLTREQAISILLRIYMDAKAQLRIDRYYYNTFCNRKNIELHVDKAIELTGFTSMEKLTSAKVIRQLHTYLTYSTDIVDMLILKLAELGISVHDIDSDAIALWPYVYHPTINYKKCIPGYLIEARPNIISLQRFLKVDDPKTLRVCLFLFNEHLFPSQILFYPRLVGSNVAGLGELVLSVAKESNEYIKQMRVSQTFSVETNLLYHWNQHSNQHASDHTPDPNDTGCTDTWSRPFSDVVEVTFTGGGSNMHGLARTLESYINTNSTFNFRVVTEASAWKRIQDLARNTHCHITFTPTVLAESAKGIPKQIREKQMN